MFLVEFLVSSGLLVAAVVDHPIHLPGAGKGGGNDPGGGGHSGPGNYAGAGIGHRAPNMTNAASRGWANTGGGGGGAGGNPNTPVGDGGDGGSGIVLIAYPS